MICICNDLHAPQLRPLRAVAELVEFRTAANSQLIARLRRVCKQERLGADMHALGALATLHGHDVRACLNALQFVRAKSAMLDEHTLLGAGYKASSKSPFALWKQVFTALPTKHAHKQRSASAPPPRARQYGGAPPPPPSRADAYARAREDAAAAAAGGGGGVSSSAALLKELELADVSKVLTHTHTHFLSHATRHARPCPRSRVSQCSLCVLCWPTSPRCSKGSPRTTCRSATPTHS